MPSKRSGRKPAARKKAKTDDEAAEAAADASEPASFEIVEAEAELPAPFDKRESERVAVMAGLSGEIKVYLPLVVEEISRAGATIETTVKLQLNSLHEIRLTLGGRSVVVKGRVAHARISGVQGGTVTYRAGVEFVEPTEGAAAAIGEFVEQLKTGRG